jgi:hypothetical protein
MLFVLLTVQSLAFGQNFKEKELKTEIKEVTVFLNGAQIFEHGSVPLAPGKTLLTIRGLPSYVDDKSIQVKGDGDFTILSVNHKLNYLSALKHDEKLDSLHRIDESIDMVLAKENAKLAVLNEKLSLLNSNKSLGGTNNGVSIAQLKQAIELFESEMLKIKEEEIRIRSGVETRKKEQEKIQKQLKELNDQGVLPSGEIEIRVNAETPVTGKFRVTYLVGNAGWFPKYDVRVENIKSPLQIIYKAEVFQNTGVDWKNVKLRFSNGNPNQSGVVPNLNAWNLNFARYTGIDYNAFSASLYGSRAPSVTDIRNVKGKVVDSYGQPLPGVNVVIRGTTIGTVTDAGGNYSLTLPNNASTLTFSFIGYQAHEVPVTQSEMNVALSEDVAELQEVVVVGYGEQRGPIRVRGTSSVKAKKPDSRPMVTTTIENQTTVEIEVAEPYSIKSNGEKLMVDLKRIDAEAIYQYYAIPKLDKDAFLVARIVKWDKYNLLEGEANLYFEDAYVGRSILNAKSLEDTLDISLGRDKNIVIGREKKEQYCKRKSIGSNIEESRGFKIMVRNKKSQPIKISIFDQIPVSVISDISVNAEELSGGKLDERSGKITWELTLDAQQQKEIDLHYEVKYPKKERVYLE